MECRICKSTENHKEYKVREMMFGLREEFVYFQCADCGCLQIRDIPSDMARYYPQNYYSIADAPEKYSSIGHFIGKARTGYAVFNKGILGKILYYRFPHLVLRSLAHVKNINLNTRILDVGCGSGNALYSLRLYGFNNLLGVEPYLRDDITYSNGLKIVKKQIFDISGEFDVIMFHHSFEHIDTPLETIQATRKFLAPDGVCIIRIPVVDSWAWDHYSTDWGQIDAPRHFFLHSRKSMAVLAKVAGLRIDHVYCDSTEFQFWLSEQYRRDIPRNAENSYFVNPAKSIFTKSEMQSFRKLARQLNAEQKGDQAVFYLKRI
jgi:SAM-dependent methyltransferase